MVEFPGCGREGAGELGAGWWMGGGAGYLSPSKEREREGVEGWFEGGTHRAHIVASGFEATRCVCDFHSSSASYLR